MSTFLCQMLQKRRQDHAALRRRMMQGMCMCARARARVSPFERTHHVVVGPRIRWARRPPWRLLVRFEEPLGPHAKNQQAAPVVSVLAAASNLTMTAMGVGILALASTVRFSWQSPSAPRRVIGSTFARLRVCSLQTPAPPPAACSSRHSPS